MDTHGMRNREVMEAFGFGYEARRASKKEGKNMSRQQKMRWHAGRGKFLYSLHGHYSVRLEDGTSIEVDPDVYNQRFNAYLERIGVKRTSWSAIMQQAEKQWQDYCDVMDTFAENYHLWLDDQQCGVFVERPQREACIGVECGSTMLKPP
jgi:hypothetical protein